MGWQEYRRTDSVAASGTAFVSFRRVGIAFSAGFVHAAKIDKAKRVSLLIDEPKRRVGFRFHSREADENAYTLVVDGSNGKHARAIQNARIYAQFAWLAAVLQGQPRDRRFVPQRDDKADLWFVEIAPNPRRESRA